MDSLELIGQATENVVPQLTVDEETEKYARLIAEPLESGYGITLGNALRRVLLSSLEGAAITSVRVEQVQHEFSTIAGLQEDTTEFLLNAKEIRIRALSNRSGTLALDIEGPCEVTAGDLQVPADFEIVNPELHLATHRRPQGAPERGIPRRTRQGLCPRRLGRRPPDRRHPRGCDLHPGAEGQLPRREDSRGSVDKLRPAHP